MISCLKSGFFILFFLTTQAMPARNDSDSDPVLHNGKIYTYHLHPGTKGHQFLTNHDFSKGWLKIRGIVYDCREINYDVFHQQVIMQLTSGVFSGKVALSDAWLDAFGYDDMNFEVTGNAERKIFQVLGKEPCRVFYRWTKTLDLSKQYGARNHVFSKPKKEMFLAINDTLLRYSGNKQFITHLGSKLNDDVAVNYVRDFLKRNRLNIRSADDQVIEELLAYCAGFFKHVKGMSDAGTEMAVKNGIRIFFKSGFPDNFGADDIPDTLRLITGLNRMLEGTGLVAEKWNKDIVIIPAGVFIKTLPDYQGMVVTDSIRYPGRKITETEAKYLTGRSPEITQVITVGKQGANTAGGKARILVRILDAETGEPLVSVPVYISEIRSGSVTDVNGLIDLALTPANYTAEIAYLGYASRKFILRVLSDGDLTIILQKAVIRLQDVTVSASIQSGMNIKDAGLDQISVSNLKSLPVLMGEQDALKASVTLPGIVVVGEGSAGLNVRGGGYDQNSFYINRIPVYNTTHLFGFFSSFNSDIIRNISIYKGYIPVQYGGRLASVFDITARQGNRKHFTARGGVSPVTGNITIEGPFRKGNGSFILSGRSSYSDWILSRLKDTTVRSSRAKFNDFSGGLNMDKGKSRLSLFFYSSYDRFRSAEITDYHYSNQGASAIFSHTHNNAFRSEVSLSGSVYDYASSDKLEPSSAYTHAYRLGHYGASVILRHVMNESNKLDYGVDASLYDLDRGTVRPYNDRSLRRPLAMGRERGIEAFMFISDFFRITPLISIDVGIRYGLFFPTGPAYVYVYRSGMQPDPRYITDTLNFKRNEPVRIYPEPDIRASVNIRTGEFGSVKAAFNQMHQNIFMLNAGITLAPNTQWKLADYHLRPSESNLFSLGFFRTFPSIALEASAEIYYKKVGNYPEFRDGADFLKNSHVETLVLQGWQEAYGFEFYIKRSSRKLAGWLSYAFSRSVLSVNGSNPWDRINKGEPYSSNYDIPHSVNAILSYHFTRRVILSSSFTYQTGKPVTFPESAYYMEGSQYLHYSGRNAYRIPDYMRIDLALRVEGNLKTGKPVHSSYIFNLYNATGRMNPHSVYFKSENGGIKSYMYSVIGVPVFTVTWQFKLGNYATD